MNEKILLDAVLLAGKLMLVSGAEIYRVEDTMKYMLKKSGYETSETIVLATGIFMTVNHPGMQPVTMVKRVPDRSTDMNKISMVNDVSRKYCSGAITIEQAYEELKQIEHAVIYKPWVKFIGIIGVSVFFTPIFNGTSLDFCASAVIGTILALTTMLVKKIRLNDFCINALFAFVVAFSSMALQRFFLPDANVDVLIISSIMTLVPGVVFTNAIRDTLNGDYMAGTARMLEAAVVALAVAAGVAFGIILFGSIWGGI